MFCFFMDVLSNLGKYCSSVPKCSCHVVSFLEKKLINCDCDNNI